MIHMKKTARVALLLVLLAGPAVLVADDSLNAQLVESLRAAEISFATSVAEQDIESFGSHIDPDAIFMGGRPLAGREAILEAWSVYFQDGGPTLEWHPEDVVVRANGKMGISKGPYTLRARTPDGREQIQKGSFASIWELQADGTWRVIFDSGCTPCPECPSP